MKVTITFLLVIGLTGTCFVNANPRIYNRALHDDLDDFLALVPKDEILNIFLTYLERDEEVQYATEYLQTSEFRELVKAVESIPDVINFYKYLQQSGLDIYYLVNKLHEMIGLPPLVPPNRSAITITGGVAGLIADIKAILPIDDIKALYHEKLVTSEEFKKLVDRLQSPKFQAVVDTLLANPQFQEILNKAKAVGVDVKAIADLLSTIFGLQFPEQKTMKISRDLHDDLEDFLKLIPTDKVSRIFLDYLKHDEEVQSVVEYTQTSEFRELVKAVESISDVINFYDYIQEAGLDVYYLVNKLHDFVGLPPLTPSNGFVFRRTGGVSGLIADIKAILPISEIKALYQEKLEKSIEFKELIEKLQSPKFQAVVDTLIANPEFQEILKKAKAAGIDVKAFADLLSTVFGLEFSQQVIRMSRNLHDDLQDFIDLVPTDEISNIFLEYLTHDEEVQFVVEYVQSSEFRELVKAVESIPDVINFYNYLEAGGLDVYYMVNKLHEFIGLPPLVPLKTSLIRKTEGVAGLIAEIKAILPIDDIKALYYKKLETSVEFKKLVEHLQSPKFQAVVDTLLANPEFQEILKKANEFGVDVQAIADLLSTIFGLQFPLSNPGLFSRLAYVNFDDFVALIPMVKITKIFNEYSKNDNEIINLLQFFQTEEFKNIINDIDHIANVRYMYQYLDKSGLDIYRLVNALHSMLELPEFQQGTQSVKMTGGLRGLLIDIQCVLPIRKFVTLHKQKMQNDPVYHNFITQIHSQQFKDITEAILTDNEFKTATALLESRGFDVAVIIDFIECALHFHDSQSVVYNLQDDLNDFILLIPIEKVADITIKYIINDVEVQDAVKYIKSEELKDLVIKLQNDPEVYQGLKYLKDSGIDIFTFLNILNDLLNFPPYPTPETYTRNSEITGGVQGMLNEIRAILPHDEIKAMYDHKVATSVDFQYFVGRIKDPEFQSIVDILVVNKNILELGHQAQLHGIKIENMIKFLSEVFGLQLPDVPDFSTLPKLGEQQRDLADDFDDFYSLLPIDDIVDITIDYVLNDKEMQEAFIYLQSEEFKVIIRTLHGIPEYKQILDKLEAAGVDIKFLINMIDEMIGFNEILKSPRVKFVLHRTIQESGMTGYINTIRKLLPYKEIKALYNEKLTSSKPFSDFIAIIKSQTFQSLTNQLFENKNFQQLLSQAQAHGVNLKLISDFFFNVFGITTPPGIINNYY